MKSYIVLNIVKKITIIIMSIFYISAGINHFYNTNWFLKIMPPYIPYHLELVYISGVFEILLGSLLLFNRTRKYAAYGLILLLIAVFPANIYLAFNEEPQKLISISSLMASWVRLPLQFVLIGIAYWHSKKRVFKLHLK